jgi:hypothetical protein
MASSFPVFAGESFVAQVRVKKEVGLQYFLSQKYTKVSQKCHCFLVLAEWLNGPKELSAFFKRWHLER